MAPKQPIELTSTQITLPITLPFLIVALVTLGVALRRRGRGRDSDGFAVALAEKYGAPVVQHQDGVYVSVVEKGVSVGEREVREEKEERGKGEKHCG